MPLPFSKSQVDRLADRIRKSEAPAAEDIHQLQLVISAYDTPLRLVNERLKSAGITATGRLKTQSTLLAKLRTGTRLTTIRDVAGTRIVQEMSLNEQDALTLRIQQIWPESKLIDRRKDPSSGYRAVHLEVFAEELPVEIQVRTHLQHFWAELFEAVADKWGRQIRYGAHPDNPNIEFNGRSRSEVVSLLKDLSDHQAKIEDMRALSDEAANRVSEAEARNVAIKAHINRFDHESREPTTEEQQDIGRLDDEFKQHIEDAKKALATAKQIDLSEDQSTAAYLEVVQQLQDLFKDADRAERE